jgi:hypothetical protein
MEEEEKLSLMANNNRKKVNMINLIALLLFIFSCNEKKQSNLKKDNLIVKKEIITVNTFAPDSTVNTIIRLKNENSSIKFYPLIKKNKLLDYVRESPVKFFSNNSNTEYLLAYNYEGDVEDSFSCFEIGIINKDFELKGAETEYDSFKTESGIKLGISLKELEKIKGKDYIQENNIITYQISDSNGSSFLKNYNMPFYFMSFEFNDNKLVKYKFGFSYP